MIDNRTTDAESQEMTKADACRQWLGVAWPAPTLYELLGAPNLARDQKVIFEAGRQAKRKLRAYQIGKYRDLALELLGDVGRAVSVLTNPEKKRPYDNELAGRWVGQAARLYLEHCAGQPPTPDALEEWLKACRREGIPIIRLLPWALRRVQNGADARPPHGEHDLALVACLWLYRDMVILGQCLKVRNLEKRAQKVKRVQKALNIPEGMARLVAEEVGRNRDALGSLRLVRQAEQHPDRTILRLGWRIRRLGGHLDRRSKVLQAAASLLGKSRYDLVKLMGRLDEPPVEISAARRMAIAARRASDQARLGSRKASTWVAHRPQILVGLGLLVGLAALVLALLVVVGVLRLGAPKETVPPSPPPPQQPAPPVQEPAVPPIQPPPELQEFIKKYPVDEKPPKDKPQAGDSATPDAQPPRP